MAGQILLVVGGQLAQVVLLPAHRVLGYVRQSADRPQFLDYMLEAVVSEG
jgi:hypothetical protein